MRLFFALWPPRAAAEALHEWAVAVQRSSGGRATRVDTIHLTLAFLGDVEEGRSLLRNFRVKGDKHVLPIEQGRFWKRNEIVWVGPREIPAGLREVVAALQAFLKAHDFRTEEREFAAHVTLVRNARDARSLPDLPQVSWPVNEIVLIRSRLSGEGPSYDVIQRYPLS